jgi:hypothetical protein
MVDRAKLRWPQFGAVFQTANFARRASFYPMRLKARNRLADLPSSTAKKAARSLNSALRQAIPLLPLRCAVTKRHTPRMISRLARK